MTHPRHSCTTIRLTSLGCNDLSMHDPLNAYIFFSDFQRHSTNANDLAARQFGYGSYAGQDIALQSWHCERDISSRQQTDRRRDTLSEEQAEKIGKAMIKLKDKKNILESLYSRKTDMITEIKQVLTLFLEDNSTNQYVVDRVAEGKLEIKQRPQKRGGIMIIPDPTRQEVIEWPSVNCLFDLLHGIETTRQEIGELTREWRPAKEMPDLLPENSVSTTAVDETMTQIQLNIGHQPITESGN